MKLFEDSIFNILFLLSASSVEAKQQGKKNREGGKGVKKKEVFKQKKKENK